MDRREAILRELNLYPLWQRRGQPAPEVDAAPAPSPSTGEGGGEGVRCAASRPGENELCRRQSEVSSLRPSEVDTQQAAAAVTTLSPSPFPASGRGESIVAGLDWLELKTRVRDCAACKLRAGCTQTVFGIGDENADWLFVGEGPGAEEDAQGEPFVGQAGKLLDNMLMAIKLKRGDNVYIANIVKCRPPNNRTPQADEIAACLPYLQRQIALIRPRVIVALGKVASNALLGREATLASLRGTPHDFHGIPLIVTYHPAYLLRSPSEKAKAWTDLCMAVKVFGSQGSAG